jgi:hypothetical protein
MFDENGRERVGGAVPGEVVGVSVGAGGGVVLKGLRVGEVPPVPRLPRGLVAGHGRF